MPKSRYLKIDFDRLQMYFGEPYVIDLPSAEGSITVLQPSIGDIVKLGEKRFYSTLNIFITNTTSYRLPLWESGVDWNELTDFQLFIMLYQGADNEVTSLLFDNVDFQNFKPYQKTKEDGKIDLILYNEETKTEINEEVYGHFSQYLRTVFNIFPEEKLTSDRIMKEWFITKDKRQKSIDEEKAEKGLLKDNSLQPVISSCVNHPGFKYSLKQLKDVGVCEFYDSVQRIQVYESATACMKGMYSGFVDGKKINPTDYNFMRDFNK